MDKPKIRSITKDKEAPASCQQYNLDWIKQDLSLDSMLTKKKYLLRASLICGFCIVYTNYTCIVYALTFEFMAHRPTKKNNPTQISATQTTSIIISQYLSFKGFTMQHFCSQTSWAYKNEMYLFLFKFAIHMSFMVFHSMGSKPAKRLMHAEQWRKYHSI